MQADDVAMLTEAVVALVREEVPQLATSGRNWKLILNGSAAGDLRLVVEEHVDLLRRCQQISN